VIIIQSQKAITLSNLKHVLDWSDSFCLCRPHFMAAVQSSKERNGLRRNGSEIKRTDQ